MLARVVDPQCPLAETQELTERLRAVRSSEDDEITILTKVKIITGLWQVATQFPDVLDVPLPPLLRNFLAALDVAAGGGPSVCSTADVATLHFNCARARSTPSRSSRPPAASSRRPSLPPCP